VPGLLGTVAPEEEEEKEENKRNKAEHK